MARVAPPIFTLGELGKLKLRYKPSSPAPALSHSRSQNIATRQHNAPHDRASAESAQGLSAGVSKNGTLAQRAKKAKKPKASDAPAAAAEMKPRVGLLDLPPGRHLFFAVASALATTSGPLLDKTLTARNFFGLTQVCKQIREEFRPLWLRNSSVRIKIRQLAAFVRTFYPNASDYQNAPKLLQISWDHRFDCETDQMMNVTQLLQIRAHCPTLKVKFVQHAVAEKDYPDYDDDDDGCEECEDFLLGEGLDPDRDELEFYEAMAKCPHVEERRIDRRIGFMVAGEYDYLPDLNRLLSHGNSKWVTYARVSVVQNDEHETEAHIHLNRSAANIPNCQITMVGFANQFLKSVDIWGKYRMLDFEVSVKST